MKQLAATATGDIAAPIERCYALVADLESYPRWFPEGVRAAEVLRRDPESGEPRKLRTTLHLAAGPIERDFHMEMAVTLRAPELVELRRVPEEPGDPELFSVVWRLAGAGARVATQLTVELRASLNVPRLMPVGGVAQGLADRFLEAAARRLDG